MTVKNGKYVAQYIDDGNVPEKSIQPNAVELSIGKLESIDGVPRVREDNYNKGTRTPEPIDNSGYYTLTNGAYVVTYDEEIAIPKDCIGYVFPRSRLMRSGGFMASAQWDSGYVGKGEGLLLAQTKMKVEAGMNIAQIAFIDAEDSEELYDGSHQNEGL